MGKLCSKQSQDANSFFQNEPEIKIISYKNDDDKFFENIENKFNYFHKILFVDYLHSLVNFSSENATLEETYENMTLEYSMNDAFFTELFTSDYFQSFLENKILKHKALYSEAGGNEKATSIFKEAFMEMSKGLSLKLSQDAKSKGDEGADQNNIIKKRDILAFGILYCIGPNSNKVKALFNIFKQDGEVKPCDNLSDFLLSLFIIPSYGIISARNKLSKCDEIGPIEKEDLKSLLTFAELKNCQSLVQITNKLLFGEDLSKTLDEVDWNKKFAEKTRDESLAFLLSPAGVRYMLKKNNNK